MSDYFDNKTLFTQPNVVQHSSHMVMDGVNPEIKTKYININTAFNNNLNDTTVCDDLSYELDLQENINNVLTCNVESVELPISMYNISDALDNNHFKIETIVSNAVTNTLIVAVSSGQYTIVELVSAINTLINAGTPIDLNVSLVNNKIQIQDTGNNEKSYNIYFGVDKSGNTDKYNFKAKLGWLLGFRDTQYTIANIATITAEKMHFIRGPQICYMVIDDFLANGRQNSFQTFLTRSQNNNNIIAKIVIDKTHYGFGSIMPANKANGLLISDKRSYNGKNDIRKMKIMLLDNYGRKIDLNGVDFSFTLKLEYQ